MTPTGEFCPGDECSTYIAPGYEEFGGYCVQCWTKMGDRDRQNVTEALAKVREPTERHEHHHAHTHHHPPQSRMFTVAVSLLSGAASAAATLAALRWLGW